jgi:ABC-type transporter Mla subunit MlaD
MPSTKKPSARRSARLRATQTDLAIGRIAKSLETAQKDLAAIGGSLGTGASAVRKDVAKLLRDASRDVTKMSRAVRRDLERLQKDVTTASKRKPARATAKSSRSKASKVKSPRAKKTPAKRSVVKRSAVKKPPRRKSPARKTRARKT